jgi:hypothetical protein
LQQLQLPVHAAFPLKRRLRTCLASKYVPLSRIPHAGLASVQCRSHGAIMQSRLGQLNANANRLPLQVSAAVSAVVSAYHGGGELVKQLKKKRRKRKGDQVTEKQLLVSLEAGENQVNDRDAAYRKELGARFSSGDGK